MPSLEPEGRTDLLSFSASCAPLPGSKETESHRQQAESQKLRFSQKGRRGRRQKESLQTLKTSSKSQKHFHSSRPDSPCGRRSLRPLAVDGVEERRVPEPERVPETELTCFPSTTATA